MEDKKDGRKQESRLQGLVGASRPSLASLVCRAQPVSCIQAGLPPLGIRPRTFAVPITSSIKPVTAPGNMHMCKLTAAQPL